MKVCNKHDDQERELVDLAHALMVAIDPCGESDSLELHNISNVAHAIADLARAVVREELGKRGEP